MAIRINNVEYLNYEEQVMKNKRDIQNISPTVIFEPYYRDEGKVAVEIPRGKTYLRITPYRDEYQFSSVTFPYELAIAERWQFPRGLMFDVDDVSKVLHIDINFEGLSPSFDTCLLTMVVSTDIEEVGSFGIMVEVV